MFDKQTSHRSLFSKIKLVLGHFLMLSCTPQGEISRKIHPTYQAYIRTSAGEASTAENSAMNNRRLTGLPPHCKTISPSSELTCIACQDQATLIERCINYSGMFNPSNDCIHNRDHIKCLFRDGPRGITVSLRRPCEKLVRENYLQWEEAVWSIWESRLKQSDFEKLLAVLKLLNETSLWISQRRLDKVEDYELITYLPFEVTQNHRALGEARKTLAILEKHKWNGKLTLELFLTEWKRFLAKQGMENDLLAILTGLNLKGLEDDEPLVPEKEW